MSWTPTLKDKRQGEVSWAWVFVYSDGQRMVVKQYTTATDDDAVIASILRAEIAGFDRVNKSVGTYKIGDVIDLTLPAPSPPSAEDQARADFYNARGVYSRMLEDVRLTLRKADDSTVTAAQQDMLAKFKPEYL